MSHGQFYFFLANMWATVFIGKHTDETHKVLAGIVIIFLVLAALS